MLTKSEKKEIQSLRDEARDILNRITEIVESAMEKFDAKSDKWKNGEKGEVASGILDAAEELRSALENVVDGEFEASELDPDI